MAADVSSVLRILRGHMEEPVENDSGNANSQVLITRDLLGDWSSKDLDLDFKRADHSRETRKLQDLNFPPSYSSSPLGVSDEGSLDLRLFPFPSRHCQSVCTLEKVKSALDRAEREGAGQKRSSSSESPAKAPQLQPSSSSYSSIKEEEDDVDDANDNDDDDEDEKRSSSSSFAAACPGCLLYVLTWESNPRCPRCQSIVPSPGALKKPRIDLNAPF
ncbi:uncharacterized protein LOC131149070 [Malania oleifera]|uniref:uncharacterized protein LOC131149070 n=1 Tax=Malania oleifera TaxID=397392 RepID=UPI0025ADDA6F|nr:uncharacterized protein LOC131149070 [Malania oleifera]